MKNTLFLIIDTIEFNYMNNLKNILSNDKKFKTIVVNPIMKLLKNNSNANEELNKVFLEIVTSEEFINTIRVIAQKKIEDLKINNKDDMQMFYKLNKLNYEMIKAKLKIILLNQND